MRLPNDDSRHPLAERFRTFIRHTPFPCVGAKSALSRGQLRTIVARDIGSGWDDTRIYPALLAFICRYREQPDLFQSFAVIFEGPRSLSEEAFEAALWERVQSLSDKDGCLGQDPDPRVAADPEDPHFSLSLGGEGFFIVGLHPGASRRARRFEAPVLVFNLHDQFARLRAEGRYERLRDSIVERDVSWTGSANPMLAQHGQSSAARQFSGRAVSEDWVCPFQRRDAAAAWDAQQVAADLRSGAFVAGGMDG
ncbi:guanitoxin biosynthesis heme-dependent pre-guanitoxin N-hydroxylase GntA [Methylobacterium sp. NEAU 140]|uniref:guanitoxin biosynthesis heme-dependent pre-guanitoxin N-hydroxylase GntA n=1 Tax=Methylobacterium sp. NEAU 140 TaxID=3064945 RepID=UPI002733DBD9|nr:guanitoxin biosynthesis heme-dependent pre-guanitoxin N-hydroxylase GntA [Methylobacterium sp. NEAU 140]MDP4022542.1 guanitoxin biosynthesis heme-dependent pre-guanitoxin N-hydroxylase GntA [Methylobacterium sp. NEAU 140]